MGEGVNPTLHFRIIVEGIAVEVAEFKDISLQGGALNRCSNVDFYKNNFFEDDQALKTLDKQHHVSVVNDLAKWHYFVLIMRFIKMRVKIAKIWPITSIDGLQVKICKEQNIARGVWIAKESRESKISKQ